jgi:hypothetical protein
MELPLITDDYVISYYIQENHPIPGGVITPDSGRRLQRDADQKVLDAWATQIIKDLDEYKMGDTVSLYIPGNKWLEIRAKLKGVKCNTR